MDQDKAHFCAQHTLFDMHLIMLTGCFSLFYARVICALIDGSGHVIVSPILYFADCFAVSTSVPNQGAHLNCERS